MQPPIQIFMNLVPQKTSGGKQKNLAQTRGLLQLMGLLTTLFKLMQANLLKSLAAWKSVYIDIVV